MSDTQASLRRLVEQYAPSAMEVTLDTDFYDDLGLDSFSAVELFLTVESTTGARLAMNDFVTIRTLRGLLAAVPS